MKLLLLEVYTALFMRQGQWSKKEKLQQVYFLWLIKDELIGSVLIMLLLCFFPLEVKEYLAQFLTITGLSSDLLLLIILAFGVIGMGYENQQFFVHKHYQTLKLFMLLSDGRIFMVNVFKTMLLVLPAIVIFSFLDPLLNLWLMMGYIASYQGFKWFYLKGLHRQYTMTTQLRLINWVYLKQLVGTPYLLKMITTPLVSLVFLKIASLMPAFQWFYDANQPILASFVVMGGLYSGNQLVYALILRKRDLWYLKTQGIDLKKWLMVTAIAGYTIHFLIVFSLEQYLLPYQQWVALLLWSGFWMIIFQMWQAMQANLELKKGLTIVTTKQLTSHQPAFDIVVKMSAIKAPLVGMALLSRWMSQPISYIGLVAMSLLGIGIYRLLQVKK